MTDKLAKSIIDRFDKAKADRALIEPVLQEISDKILLHKGNFTADNSYQQIESTRVYDSTAIEAAKRLASTIHGGLTNSASRWFTLQVLGYSNLSVTSRSFLENASNIMLSIFNGSYSGFSSHNYEVIMSQVTYGTGALFVEYDYKCRTLRFSSIHLSKIFILEDRWGQIDTVFVKDEITIRQAIQEFGIDKLHRNWASDADSSPDRKVNLLHCVRPVDGTASKKHKSFKFDSIYIDIDNNHIIEDRGMFDMPYIVGRFDRRAGDVYGRSASWDAMPAVRMINQIEKDSIKADQLRSQPPMLLSDDAVMQNLNIKPFGKIIGGIDPVTGQPRIQPLQVGGDPSSSQLRVQKCVNIIREMFFVDQLYFKEGTPLTATEAMQRQEARTQMLSPAIDRIKTEYLDRLVRVCFNILLREGHFGQIPEELAQHELKVEYLSPLARLNKMQDVLAVQRALAPVAPFASMAPEQFAKVFDSIDFDKMISYSLDAAGFPAVLKRTEEELKAMKEEQQRQANLAQNLQLAQFASQLNQPVQ